MGQCLLAWQPWGVGEGLLAWQPWGVGQCLLAWQLWGVGQEYPEAVLRVALVSEGVEQYQSVWVSNSLPKGQEADQMESSLALAL